MNSLQKAKNFIKKADALALSGQYDASIQQFEFAKTFLSDNFEEWHYCVNKIALNLCRSGDFEKSNAIVERNIEEIRLNFGVNHLEIARAYYILSLGNVQSGKFLDGIDLAQKSLEIYLLKSPDNNECLLKCYNVLAVNYLYTIYQDKAYVYIKKALNIESNVRNLEERAYTYITQGNYFYGINYSKAITCYQKALDLVTGKLSINNFIFRLAYLNLAAANSSIGSYSRALDYIQEGLRLTIKNTTHYHHAYQLLIIADIYRYREDFEKSFQYYKNAEAIYNTIFADYKSTHVAKLYDKMARYYCAVNDYQNALVYFEKSMIIWEEEFEKGHGYPQNINRTLIAIGDMYLKLKDYQQAESAYTKGLNLESNNTPIDHGVPLELIATYNSLGYLYLVQKDYQKALDFISKAIQLNQQVIDENEIIFEPIALLNSLNNKLRVLNELFVLQNNIDHLHQAYEISKECETIIHKHRNFYQVHEDRIEFNKQVHETFEQAIKNCYLLHQQTTQTKYIYKSFDYFEQSKAYNLLQSIQEMQALRYSNVPDNIIEQEKHLKMQITHFENELNKTYFNKDAERGEILQNALFENRQKYHKLIQTLEQKYPAYFQLKYNPIKIKLNEVQQYLNKKMALLEYFEGEEAFYYLCIQKEKIHFFQYLKPSNWLETYNKFHTAITEKNNLLNNEKREESYQIFTETANYLYEILMAQAVECLEDKVTSLQIIPDGKLSYIPFELLLQKPTLKNKYNFKKLNYLLRNYAIGYAYSATLLLEQQIGKQTKTKETYGGFAPIYYNDTMEALEGLIAEYKENKVYSLALRDGLADLPNARRSVNKIVEIMGGKAMIAKEATKKSFIESLGNFQILHLAMHGLLDHANPLYTKLVFTPEKDSQDHLLNAGDIYNMEINAELIVLSACNTGYGKMKKGEGIMSLSRAFTYAGCPSVIMSLWSVPDFQTCEIMIRFFQLLKDGFDKHVALQKTKLEYLDQCPSSESHPLFWAGFVPVGNIFPIK